MRRNGAVAVRSNSSLRVRISLHGIVLLGISALFVGCQSSPKKLGAGVPPKIEFTDVPLAGADNPEKLSTIKGRVIGAQAGQQIVIYAKGQTTWWVQPFANQPFTKVDADSRWNNSTHPGIEYGALLVGPGFQPPLTAEVLPTQGVLAAAVTRGEVALWHRWWFPLLCVIVGTAVIFGTHRLRLHQMSKKLNLRFEERLAERTRVAQELHDTLLQGVLSASMQLHVAVDQLPENSAVRPALDRVLQLMRQVIDEGRNTVRGLRSSIENAADLKSSLSRLPDELGRQEGTDFRVVVEGTAVPLRSIVRDDVYSIGREAVVNAFRHSKASNIGVQLEYAASQLRILVRDDGCGIDPRVLESGRDGHWGLSGMRERAERIGAKLKVLSRVGGGTEVELRVPNNVAFESHDSNSASKLFKGQRPTETIERPSARRA
jgi:signal transduction histidine kinase